jgi:hypothetical protein
MLIIEPSDPTSNDSLSAALTRGESLFTGSMDKIQSKLMSKKVEKFEIHKEINCEA